MTTLQLTNLKTYSKIIAIVLFAFVISCKNKENATKNSQSAAITFKDKFHEANSEKMINHYDRSIALFTECLAIKPNSAACFFAVSEIYIIKKDQPKALVAAQRAYELNPKNKWYTVHLADLFFASGNYHKSATYYELVFNDFGEKNIDYRYKLIESLIFSNQNQKAIDQLNIIELETGKTPEISLTKHDLYNAINKGDAADKEVELPQAAEPEPEEPHQKPS